MVDNKVELDKFLTASKYSDYLTGRPEGEIARKNLKLDEKDENNEKVSVHISKKISGINISFVLGLFSKSILKYGKDEFFNHYIFEYETEKTKNFVEKDILEGVDEALKRITPETLFNRLLRKSKG